MSAATTAECFLVFTLGTGTYAIPATRLCACLSLPRLTALDDTADWVVGAFDLHGELTPVISIAACMGAPLPSAAHGDLVIVSTVASHPLGFHADGILGVEPPAAGAQRAGDAMAVAHGVLLTGGRTWLIVPERLAVSAADAGAASTPAETRLQAFERTLTADDLAVMDGRAARYSGLMGAPAAAALRC